MEKKLLKIYLGYIRVCAFQDSVYRFFRSVFAIFVYVRLTCLCLELFAFPCRPLGLVNLLLRYSNIFYNRVFFSRIKQVDKR